MNSNEPLQSTNATEPASADIAPSGLRLQRKLSVGASNDPHELEADQVADQVMAAPARPSFSAAAPRVQRYSHRTNGSADNAPISVDNVLAGSGRQLDASLQQDMGQRFNYDFSHVKIHTGAAADQSAREMDAKAYTLGNDIVFGANSYAPDTQRGRKLIAHELTHVVQQGSSGSASKVIARQPADEAPWIQDQDGALYYKTKAQAEARMAALKKADEWQDLRVTSFKLKGSTFWRVEMRGRKSVSPQAPVQTAPAPTTPSGNVTPQLPVTDKADAGLAAGAAAAGAAAAGAAAAGAAAAGAAAAGATRVYSLTFDDGPHAAKLGTGTNLTENVLDTLKTKGVKAGFFIQTGVSFRGANPVGQALVTRMQADGHTVGIHTGGTTDHELHTSAQKAGRLESELKSAQSYITKQTGASPTLVRPPTGASNSAVDATYKKIGLSKLLWDIDGDHGAGSLAQLKARLNSTDPKDPGIPAVQARGWTGTTAARPKIVVLYHDIRANTSSNIGDVIDHIRAETKAVSGGKDTADFAPP